MGLERYTKQPPTYPGWWWMKQDKTEQVIHVFRSEFAQESDGVKGLWASLINAQLKSEISLVELCQCNILWSRYPVRPPSEADYTGIRITAGEHNVEVHITDSELFTSMSPEIIIERYLAESVSLLFESLHQDRLKETRHAIHEHFALLRFIGQKNPEMMNQFRSEYQIPDMAVVNG